MFSTLMILAVCGSCVIYDPSEIIYMTLLTTCLLLALCLEHVTDVQKVICATLDRDSDIFFVPYS